MKHAGQKLVPSGRSGGFAVEYPFPIDPTQEQYRELHDKDGGRHFISKRAYLQSPYFKRVDQKGPIKLDISSDVMGVVIHYLYYKLRYGAQVAKNKTTADIPVFAPIPVRLAAEVADAASLLEL
ncbi:Hypothetical protein DHA2_20307 [Giardia duodenalis]|uniref:Uncharacterized protein n=1 Tax=Giardia intestinalis TaxID=5741 RepID=V6TCA4_GIAIN|nr:Hypothetical protein DHA2_20307 [Giardia intestinalis]